MNFLHRERKIILFSEHGTSIDYSLWIRSLSWRSHQNSSLWEDAGNSLWEAGSSYMSLHGSFPSCDTAKGSTRPVSKEGQDSQMKTTGYTCLRDIIFLCYCSVLEDILYLCTFFFFLKLSFPIPNKEFQSDLKDWFSYVDTGWIVVLATWLLK